MVLPFYPESNLLYTSALLIIAKNFPLGNAACPPYTAAVQHKDFPSRTVHCP